MPDSSSNLSILCSGALIDGKITRLEGGRGLAPVGAPGSIAAASCITGRSGLLRGAPPDTRSFHILPSWWLKRWHYGLDNKCTKPGITNWRGRTQSFIHWFHNYLENIQTRKHFRHHSNDSITKIEVLRFFMLRQFWSNAFYFYWWEWGIMLICSYWLNL